MDQKTERLLLIADIIRLMSVAPPPIEFTVCGEDWDEAVR